jgi:hypothetical protein
MQDPESNTDSSSRPAECLVWPMERALRLALEIKDSRQEIEQVFRQISDGQPGDSEEGAEARIATLIARVRECGMEIDRIVGGKGHWRSWIYDWNERLKRSSFARLA